MAKKRNYLHDAYLARVTHRCRLCKALLCLMEGVRRKGYGIICLACAMMTRRAEARQQLTQAMIDARDERSLAKEKCERDGACRRR